MPDIIGYQDGIEATRLNLNKLDPGKAGYDKQAATLETLKDGHNEVWEGGGIADRVAALEARIPFPFRVSSTSPGA